MIVKVELHKRSVKLKSGKRAQYWTLRWWGTDGRRFSESVGRVGVVTKNEAETARREKELAIGGGKLKRNRPEVMTLAEYVEVDLEAVRGLLKRSTIESIRHSAAHAIAAWGPHIKLTQLGPQHVGRLKSYMLDEAGLSPTTLAKTMRTLKAMLNRALKAGLIHENPFVGAKMPRTPSRPKRIFSPEETRAMRAAASTLWWEVFIALAETSGLRRGELVSLHWRDIDFESGTVRVSTKRAQTVEVPERGQLPILAWSAKSHEERSVPIPESTVRLLADLQSKSDGSPYVFVSLDRLERMSNILSEKGELGPNYEPVNNMKARFDLIQRNAQASLAQERGVTLGDCDWPRGTIHDLRRTYGTRMARIVPMHVLKEYMGHASIATTQAFYLAAETRDADRARTALESMLGTHSKPEHQRRNLRRNERGFLTSG